MNVFEEPKIDSHFHVLDPARFPYAADVAYRPSGQEIGTLAQYEQVMQAYGITHALIVGPNSGYGLDNRCLLDVLAQGAGRAPRFKGVAVVRNDITREALLRLREAGVVGVAFNATVMGVDYYAQTASLLRLLADLDLFVQVQVEHEQLLGLHELLVRSGARIVVDHCGRPHPLSGLQQAGFQSLLALAKTGRAAVKLSGLQKFSLQGPPYEDGLPYLRALIDAFTLDNCVWASDWPFLKAPQRLDVGPLILNVQRLLPDAADRKRLWWDSPRRWFGFA
jgi:predicted TIM-barrel fold metal-dependent hydrolase